MNPFGVAVSEVLKSTIDQPIRFQGQLLDWESGLFYNRNRYFQAERGAYITKDPIGLLGGINAYAYVGNNPTRYVDPLGLVRWDQVGSNTVGLLGSGAGVLLGGALVSMPTGVTQVLGGVVLAKSLHSFATSSYGLTRSFSDDASYDIPSKYQTLPRTVATTLSCSPNAERYADAAELAIDLAAGRAPAGFKSNPSGYLRSPVGYPPMDSSHFTSPATFSQMSSASTNLLTDILQGSQTIQYGLEAAK